MHGSSAHSLADDVSLYITPMIQPLSQTDSVLNSKVSYNLISTKMLYFGSVIGKHLVENS